MKSVFITFLMFIVLFGLLQLNIASVFEGYGFFVISLIVFLGVIITAVTMFGLPTKKDFKKALSFKKEEKKDEKDD